MDKNIVMLGSVSIRKYGLSPSIVNINRKIDEYTQSIYGNYGYSKGIYLDIKIDNKIINSEYIAKMCNNYTVFREIISIYKVKTAEEFQEVILNNLKDIYHPNGKYFKYVLNILINTTRKGNIGEESSLKFFKDTLEKSIKSIEIQTPTYDEDVSGIDAKFMWNNRLLTIQVKPFELNKTFEKESGVISAFSRGSLSLNTSYLVLYELDKFIIIKSKDVKIVGNNFYFHKEKIKKNFEIH